MSETKTFQAVRVYGSGMISVTPLGKVQARNETEAKRLARRKFPRQPGSKVEVWAK
jgi:hypothetical protein